MLFAKQSFAIAAILACAAGPGFAGGDAMRGVDLGAAVSGKTIQGNMKTSGDYTEYYAPDGTLKGNNYTGKWRIDDNDRLCVTYDAMEGESCWHGHVEGNSVTWLRDGREDGRGAISGGDIGGFRGGDHGRR